MQAVPKAGSFFSIRVIAHGLSILISVRRRRGPANGVLQEAREVEAVGFFKRIGVDGGVGPKGSPSYDGVNYACRELIGPTFRLLAPWHGKVRPPSHGVASRVSAEAER